MVQAIACLSRRKGSLQLCFVSQSLGQVRVRCGCHNRSTPATQVMPGIQVGRVVGEDFLAEIVTSTQVLICLFVCFSLLWYCQVSTVQGLSDILIKYDFKQVISFTSFTFSIFKLQQYLCHTSKDRCFNLIEYNFQCKDLSMYLAK